ncbi:DUF4846 domain-containing protein [Hymenobacter saemangeumensis]|uniref:DUF4846 domain-containing protein n=1 Tax=Hymenobacter saemangeumensis TaxID=1084522 RepID=A0ABP8I335_9BACT
MRTRLLLPILPLLLACGALEPATTKAAVADVALPEAPPLRPAALAYPWLPGPGPMGLSVATRFPAPAGTQRVPVPAGSWGEWLRWLPLLPAGTPARHYDGSAKNRQDVVAAVVNIDIGKLDLQQCADAVIRLRAEYLFAQDPNKIHFHLTTGYDFWFSDYVGGKTFKVRGEEVTPAPKAVEKPTHEALGRYLIPTFGYAGTLSLSRELRPVPLAGIQPGDVLIHGGAPGHAVLVVDVAENPKTKQKYMLLAQSYMPAQNIHVLKNLYAEEPALRNGAWFAVPDVTDGQVGTPEWTFGTNELARF